VADRIKGSHFPYTIGWSSGERIATAIRALTPPNTTADIIRPLLTNDEQEASK